MLKRVVLCLAALSIFFGICAHAQMSEEAKIDHLINAVKKAPDGTTFIRNGKEYGSEQAADHLRTKYQLGKEHAGTAELFIEHIASRSSMTGIAYRIKFADGKTVSAHEFFLQELKKIEQE